MKDMPNPINPSRNIQIINKLIFRSIFFYNQNIDLPKTNQLMNQKKQVKNKLRHCVLIAESLQSDFDLNDPFVEVGNNAVIDYTFNWLSEYEVEEVFVFYSTLKEKMEDYFQNIFKNNQMKIHLNFMKPSQLKSFGDVMREAHFRNLLSEDFLVLFADNFTNIDLTQMIQNHFQKKTALKNVVLTTTLQSGPSKLLYLLNSNTNEILQVENEASADFKEFILNSEKINIKKTNVELRRDLNSVDIYICTMDVVNSFKENIEYQNMNDFIIGMLTSEVYEEKINAYILENNQLSYRINTAKQYYSCFMSYICGYLYPYTIHQEDKNNKKNIDRTFVVRDFNKIVKKGVKISQNAYLSHNIYLGVNTKVAENCRIEKSIVGNGCTLNKNVHLNHCIVLEDCILAENSQFSYCLIEKVNGSLKINSFRQYFFEEYEKLIQKEIFLDDETINNIQSKKETYEEELKNLLSQKVDLDTIDGQLKRLLKQNGKQLNELTSNILSILKPQGIKGISQFVTQWGQILLRVHDKPGELLDSLYFSCKNSEDYSKAFHVLIQYCYNDDIISDEDILTWHDKNYTENDHIFKLCQTFIQHLREAEDDDDEADG